MAAFLTALAVTFQVFITTVHGPAHVHTDAASTATYAKSKTPTPGAAPHVQQLRAGAIPGLSFVASPQIADVGDQVTLTVSAKSWPASASVTASFLSGHHGFTGNLPWRPSCSCFQVSVGLAKRVHPLEVARAVAKVSVQKSVATVRAGFLIRGLAPNGRDFARGGPVSLQAWVGDPTPVANQKQHFCGWVKTPDGLGVAGYRITYVVHYRSGTQQFVAGPTGRSGVMCVNRSIGNAPPGIPVGVDEYSGGLHGHTTFKPRKP